MNDYFNLKERNVEKLISTFYCNFVCNAYTVSEILRNIPVFYDS